jgi:hypothetical protein
MFIIETGIKNNYKIDFNKVKMFTTDDKLPGSDKLQLSEDPTRNNEHFKGQLINPINPTAI